MALQTPIRITDFVSIPTALYTNYSGLSGSTTTSELCDPSKYVVRLVFAGVGGVPLYAGEGSLGDAASFFSTGVVTTPPINLPAYVLLNGFNTAQSTYGANPGLVAAMESWFRYMDSAPAGVVSDGTAMPTQLPAGAGGVWAVLTEYDGTVIAAASVAYLTDGDGTATPTNPFFVAAALSTKDAAINEMGYNYQRLTVAASATTPDSPTGVWTAGLMFSNWLAWTSSTRIQALLSPYAAGSAGWLVATLAYTGPYADVDGVVYPSGEVDFATGTVFVAGVNSDVLSNSDKLSISCANNGGVYIASAGASGAATTGVPAAVQATYPLKLQLRAPYAGYAYSFAIPDLLLPTGDYRSYDDIAVVLPPGSISVDLSALTMSVDVSGAAVAGRGYTSISLSSQYTSETASLTGVSRNAGMAAAYTGTVSSLVLVQGSAFSIAANYAGATGALQAVRAGLGARYAGASAAITARRSSHSALTASVPSRTAALAAHSGAVAGIAISAPSRSASLAAKRGAAFALGAEYAGATTSLKNSGSGAFFLSAGYAGYDAALYAAQSQQFSIAGRYVYPGLVGLAIQDTGDATMIVTASTQATAELASSPFQEVVQCGDVVYALTSEGFVEVGADTDAGAAVVATLSTFKWAPAAGQQVQLAGLYLSGRIGAGSVTVDAEAAKESVSPTYSFDAARAGLWKQRVVVGRGLRADRMSFDLSIKAPFAFTSFDLVVTPSTRRI